MKGPQFIIDLSAIALAEKTRIPIALLGRFVKGGQKFAITAGDMTAMVENFRRKKTAETVIDYDHASEFPEVAQGQPIPAAGWLKAMDDAPDASGVLWGAAEFTERALKMLGDKEYKYLSPVISWGARDKSSGEQQAATLTSMALTNRPFLEGLPAIQLSEAWEADTSTEKTKGEPMVKKVVLADRAAATVRVIAEDDTERVLSVEGLLPEPKVVRLSDVKRGGDGRFDFLSLAPQTETLIAGEVFHAMLSQEALDAAVKAGKITPAQRPHYESLALSDLPGFNKLVATMKPQVELSERGVAGDGTENNDLKAVDARIEQLVTEKRAADKTLGYGPALKLVASEHPDLAKRKLELQRKQGRDA